MNEELIEKLANSRKILALSSPFKQKLLERNCYRHIHFRNTLLMAHQTNDLSTTYNVKKVSFRTIILRKKYLNGPRAFVAFSSKLITVQDDELREL